MAKVEIADELKKEILKKFKKKSIEIFELFYSLGKNPSKGKTIGNVGGIVIKELKYEGFRFYFITNGYQLRILDIQKLKEIIFKFVRMSNKKYQQETIDEIKKILRNFGEKGFE